MNGYQLSSRAEAQLDGIWLRIARDSGSIDYSLEPDEVLIHYVFHGSQDIEAFFYH